MTCTHANRICVRYVCVKRKLEERPLKNACTASRPFFFYIFSRLAFPFPSAFPSVKLVCDRELSIDGEPIRRSMLGQLVAHELHESDSKLLVDLG